MSTRSRVPALLAVALLALPACGSRDERAPEATKLAPWEIDNPVVALPTPPLGAQADFAALKFKVTPETVRLGRWLFYDGRLSSDGKVPCAACHRPENAFSEPTAHSTGVGGKEGNRKSPTFINGAWPFYEVYFWDGRASSLVEQAKGPMANPIEMASTHDLVVKIVSDVPGYRKAFQEAYSDATIDIQRVAEAIAAYEATRMSGNSAWDRFEAGDRTALSELARQGNDLFFGKADCAQCHVGWNFTDSAFHNLGIGWDPASKSFADVGRAAISGKKEDTGAFKTPTLREVSRHAPYMHDGSLATLRDTVLHYDKGGTPNPWLSERVKPLKLSSQEVDAVVAFMEALDGEGYQDTAPKSFPQ